MRLYNTLSNKIEDLKPLKDKEIKIYVCGITPYDTTHLGHAFTYLFFDTLIRYLKFNSYKVNYTQNVTDIDDDILRRAKEEKKDWKELGNFWTERFLDDLKFLNITPPENYVKATDSITQIIEIVQFLFDRKFAYQKGGNVLDRKVANSVYFDVRKFNGYGKLSKYSKLEMIRLSKERGGNPNDPNKKDPLDFILWQKSKSNEPFWESPWGKGRPGWHIECSAMIYKYLGEQIDIHGGGQDLVFPHHESEIAQSESFTMKVPFVKYWMHVAMVRYKGEKMSKSLGNLVMVSDLSKKYSSNVIRFLLLSHHYRSTWELKDFELEKVKEKVIRIERALSLSKKSKICNEEYLQKFTSFLDEDFNTPDALNFIYKTSQELKNNQKEEIETVRFIWEMLGFS